MRYELGRQVWCLHGAVATASAPPRLSHDAVGSWCRPRANHHDRWMLRAVTLRPCIALYVPIHGNYVQDVESMVQTEIPEHLPICIYSLNRRLLLQGTNQNYRTLSKVFVLQTNHCVDLKNVALSDLLPSLETRRYV